MRATKIFKQFYYNCNPGSRKQCALDSTKDYCYAALIIYIFASYTYFFPFVFLHFEDFVQDARKKEILKTHTH